MTNQTTDFDYAQLGGSSTEDQMNLPASDRNRPQDDADATELPGTIQQPPSEPEIEPKPDRPKNQLQV